MKTCKIIKLNRGSLMVSILREIYLAIIAFPLLLLPQKFLESRTSKQIEKFYLNKLDRVIFYKSGRSALSALFQMALHKSQEKVILLPDYICNVVYLAAEQAGAVIISYPTDEFFRPNLQSVEDLLKSMPVSVVLFASIFGSKNNHQALLTCVRAAKPNVLLVYDECQNIETNSQIHLDARTAMVISFNDKTVPGLMGGAICLPPNSEIILEPPTQNYSSKFLHDLNLLGMLIKRVMRKLGQFSGFRKTYGFSSLQPKYEFTQAVFEPYDTKVGAISKFSLIYAWLGLHRLPNLESQRKQNSFQIRKMLADTGCLNFIATEYIDTAPYMPVKGFRPDIFNLHDLHIKMPYAMPNHPEVSLRPDVFGVINNPDVQLIYEDA